jgi:hypothetical protein
MGGALGSLKGVAAAKGKAKMTFLGMNDNEAQMMSSGSGKGKGAAGAQGLSFDEQFVMLAADRQQRAADRQKASEVAAERKHALRAVKMQAQLDLKRKYADLRERELALRELEAHDRRELRAAQALQERAAQDALREQAAQRAELAEVLALLTRRSRGE